MKIKTKRGPRRTRNQRVIDRRFVVTDYEGCSYITDGKLYRVINSHIINNNGIRIFILVHKPIKCAHLDDIGTWYHPIR